MNRHGLIRRVTVVLAASALFIGCQSGVVKQNAGTPKGNAVAGQGAAAAKAEAPSLAPPAGSEVYGAMAEKKRATVDPGPPLVEPVRPPEQPPPQTAPEFYKPYSATEEKKEAAEKQVSERRMQVRKKMGDGQSYEPQAQVREAEMPIRREMAGDYCRAPQTQPPPAAKSMQIPPNPMRGQGGGTDVKPAYAGFGEPFDEVWVIQKPDPGVAADTSPMPGSGELRAVVQDPQKPQEKKEIPLPLKHTEVNARVDGFISSVNVSQLYENPYQVKIEAVYLFPLPQSAAVSDFVMVIGERKIRGIIREREEAKRIYEEARNQGYQAALLQQERPNVFTQKVANIEPGNSITVEIQYFDALRYADGEYEFVFPMVVGPRFNPPGFHDGIGASPRGQGSTQAANVQYLAPGERSGHDIALSLDISAGMEIESVKSDTHVIKVEKKSKDRTLVRIAAADSLPNKDFVLRYRVAGGMVKTGLLVEKTENGGFFSLVLQPPGELSALGRTPMEMVFVVDTSGSMSGWPLDTAKKAMLRAIRNLNEGDTFQVIRFGNDASAMSGDPLPANAENIRRGLDYVQGLSAGGGTMMIEGVKKALDFPHDPRRLRVVSFMTDGFIGNEAQLLAAISQKLGSSRIFSFGIGSSVNRYLIDNMARFGRGAVAYVTTNSSPTEAVDKFYDTIAHQTLNDVTVDWGGLNVKSVYPSRIPDLFCGRPVIVTGRFEGELPGEIAVRGTVAGEERIIKVATPSEGDAKGISKLWARARIADLSNRIIVEGETSELVRDARETALAYNLVSDYTSFVAVDSSRRTEGSYGVTVNVPVPVPEGVRYDTTVVPGR